MQGLWTDTSRAPGERAHSLNEHLAEILRLRVFERDHPREVGDGRFGVGAEEGPQVVLWAEPDGPGARVYGAVGAAPPARWPRDGFDPALNETELRMAVNNAVTELTRMRQA